jgi:hypothetical protein
LPWGVRSTSGRPFGFTGFLSELAFSDQRFPAGVSEEDELIRDEDEATPDHGLSGDPPDQPSSAWQMPVGSLEQFQGGPLFRRQFFTSRVSGTPAAPHELIS